MVHNIINYNNTIHVHQILVTFFSFCSKVERLHQYNCCFLSVG